MYPVMLNVKNKICTIVGGGKVALRKAKGLLKSGASVRIVSPNIVGDFRALKIEHIRDVYSTKLIEGSFLVIAATNDENVNRKVLSDAGRLGILASSASDADSSDFILPASANCENIQIAVSTKGSFPKLARRICKEIEKQYAIYSDIADILGRYRKIVLEKVPEGNVMDKLFELFASDFAVNIAKEHGISAFENFISLECEKALKGEYKIMEKKAVLVISFGTTHTDTLEKTIGAVEKDIAEAFEGFEIRRAFTSKMVIEKLKKESNVAVDDVKSALDRLCAEGFSEVICQSTHIICGEEFHDMCKAVSAFSDKLSIKVGMPLLTSSNDYMDLVHALAEALPKEKLCLLMGHGTNHPANSAYPALDYYFKLLGFSNVYVGTVEGFPEFDTVLELIQKAEVKKALLMPLMLVAGEHAKNDMAGGENSWKSRLDALGWETECIVKGLGEYEGVRKLYVKHAKEALYTAIKK
ncbi:MAG: sirohydrochlorin cobaltochelatase [Clostridia bacterium]|nr:sirohydrochlorin cobaltochelatase [Clostridia bacterium]